MKATGRRAEAWTSQTGHRAVIQLLALVTWAGTLPRCSDDPCPPPVEIPGICVTVTSASNGDPVANATVTANGGKRELIENLTETATAGVYCGVGVAGTYTVVVSAPGYQDAQLEVEAHGDPRAECGYGTTSTQQVSVQLEPAR